MIMTLMLYACNSTPMGQLGMNIMSNPQKFPRASFFDFSLVCPEHRAKNKPLECLCRLHMLPPWKDPIDLWITKSQMGRADEAAFMAEILGEPSDEQGAVFDPMLVETTFQDNPAMTTLQCPPQGNVVFVSVDPACGGPSEMGIVSFYFSSSKALGDRPLGLTILGLESVNTQRVMMEPNWRFLVDHVNGVRKTYPHLLECATIVPIVESQGSQTTANTLCGRLSEHCQPCTLVFGRASSSSKETTYGVPTTADKKLLMVQRLQALMTDRQILIDSNFYTSGQRSLTDSKNMSSRSDMISVLVTQLKQMIDDGRNGVHGKHAVGMHDDLAMSMLMGAYWSFKARMLNSDLIILPAQRA